MDCSTQFVVVLDHLTVVAPLGRPVLALPLKLVRRKKVVSVLECFDMFCLIECHEQEDILALRNEPCPQAICEYCKPNRLGIPSRL